MLYMKISLYKIKQSDAAGGVKITINLPCVFGMVSVFPPIRLIRTNHVKHNLKYSNITSFRASIRLRLRRAQFRRNLIENNPGYVMRNHVGFENYYDSSVEFCFSVITGKELPRGHSF